MPSYIIRNVQIVNENSISTADVLIKNNRIEKIASTINIPAKVTEIDGTRQHYYLDA
jgi:dihydroorotase